MFTLEWWVISTETVYKHINIYNFNVANYIQHSLFISKKHVFKFLKVI